MISNKNTIAGDVHQKPRVLCVFFNSIFKRFNFSLTLVDLANVKIYESSKKPHVGYCFINLGTLVLIEST